MWPSLVVTGDLRGDGHAFRPEITWPDLRVVLDPQAQLDSIVAEYFDVLRSRLAGVRLFVEGTEDQEVIDTYYVPRERHNGDGVVRVHRGHGNSTHRLFSLENNLEAAFNWAEHWNLDPEQARTRQIYPEIATALRADILVTDNEFALAKPNRRWVFSVNPRESLAVIGLHQRLQDSVIINRELFDGVLATWQVEHTQAWSMIPALRDLLDQTYESGNAAFLDLVRTSGNRLKRVLDVRDRLLFESVHPNEPTLFGESEVLVEQIALNLSGMLDALARALNAALELGCRSANCSLARSDFQRRLSEPVQRILEEPESAAIMNLVRELRNTIHHEDLGSGGEGDQSGRTTARLVSVDDDTAALIRETSTLLDREGSWVAHDLGQFRLMLRPVPLVEDVIRCVTQLIQRLADAVDWPPREPRTEAPDESDSRNWAKYAPTIEVVNLIYGIEHRDEQFALVRPVVSPV